MSYILDALRRAEADRQRGAVPGLQDQPQPLSAPAAAPADDPRRTGLWALAGAGLLGIPALVLMGHVTAMWQLIALTGIVWFTGGIGLSLVSGRTLPPSSMGTSVLPRRISPVSDCLDGTSKITSDVSRPARSAMVDSTFLRRR